MLSVKRSNRKRAMALCCEGKIWTPVKDRDIENNIP
jgi:hypothetical protein